MSLSTLLLGASSSAKGKEKAIDTGLDDLFRSTAPLALVKHVETKMNKVSSNEKKRKLQDAPVEPTTSSKPKRAKSEKKSDSSSQGVSKKTSENKSHKTKATEEPGINLPESSSSAVQADDTVDNHASDPDKSDVEGDPSHLIHESLTGGHSKGKGKHAQTKYTPPSETSEQRDLRTIFVGNVALEVMKSKALTKQLKRHITSFVPDAKIESVRFRSVAFQKPTAPLEDDNRKTKPKDARQHDRERAASWRARNGDDSEDETGPGPEKVFLSTSEKKRVAYIKQEFHSGVDSVNAYIVFAHPIPSESSARPSNVPPPKPVMDPYEAARLAAEKADASMFLERTIRVDVVGKGGVKGQGNMGGDPKKTVFVGSLDFASKEQDLRVFFEGLITAERGPPPTASDESDEEEEEEEDGGDEDGKEKKGAANGVKKARTWVKRVRIIRDKDTQLGKGFGYVQFVDRECVDEVLSLEQDRLKFAKRKLRVQRCKTLPGGKNKIKLSTAPQTVKTTDPNSKAPSKTPRPPRPSAPITVPKGDPALGTKISHLTKEERKQVKSTDADRVARRLAKKKAKALAEKGVKSISDSAKDRVRKRVKDGKPGKAPKGAEKMKKRVRSNKALLKMNTKK